MLQVNNLSLSFGARKLLDSLSFNVNSGERLGLVGRNGSGKTTLFKILSGELHPDAGTIAMPKNYSIGYLKQHLGFTMPSLVEEACLGLKEEEKPNRWKAEKMLAGLGFEEADFLKLPSVFSGGFQVRLQLAKVLLAEPHMLLLDEPTNYLDILSVRWLIKFLKSRENELILITHDREFMNEVCTHTMAIHRQKVKKIEGDTVKLFNQIAVEEEIYEQTRQNEEKKRSQTEEFINRFRAKASRASLVQSRIKALDRMEQKKELGKIAELGFEFNYKDLLARIPMRANHITFGYDPSRVLIKDFSINIAKGDRICVIGKNGKGKSTLLRLLAGELKPLEGSINSHANCAIGYFGQTNIERLEPGLTVEKEFMQLRPDLPYKQIRATCGAMMFSGEEAEKKIAVLSGGEKSRVSLGKILLNPANLLLLDEPTNHLDIESCDSMIVALDGFDGAAVIVTHSELFLNHLANRLIVFDGGEVTVFEGSYQEFLEQVGWREEEKPIKEKQEKSENSEGREFNRQRKALLAKVAKIEESAGAAEEKLEVLNKMLAGAYTAQEFERAAEINRQCEKLNEEIAELYEKLSSLINQLDSLQGTRE